jgi:hypothetical protein
MAPTVPFSQAVQQQALPLVRLCLEKYQELAVTKLNIPKQRF